MNDPKPIKSYKVKIYLANGRELLTEFVSTAPFLSIHKGDLLSTAGLSLPEGFDSHTVYVSQVEHLLGETELEIIHQLNVFVNPGRGAS